MVIITLVSLYPIFLLIVTAFKSNKEFVFNKISIPIEPTLEPIKNAINNGLFFRWMLNSTIVTFTSVILAIIIAVIAAYPLAKMKFRGQNAIVNILIALLVVPSVALVVPLYALFAYMQITDTYLGITIIYAGLIIPFAVYFLISFFKTIPNELLESARIDGCTNIRILTNIIIPLSRPAIVTLIIINALWVWNELIIALIFLHSDEMRTIMVGLTVFQSRFSTNITSVFAGLLLASIPLIALYIAFQRFFIRGMIQGAIKG